ncbi:MAG: DUF3857 domain-containing protein [Lentisphaeria bacterium]|nr:DUF3857 domain-containing protein [Lentisphaeria bacterium]
MKQIFCILFPALLVLAGCRTELQDKPLKPEHSAVRTEKYPNANAVLLNDDEYIRYAPDGTSVSTDTFSYRVLTTKGRDELRTLTFRYHTNYEKISVTNLSVTKPDGRKIILDPAKLAVISIDHSQMSARIYDPNSKQLSFTIPDLEVGDILSVTRKEECFKSRIPGQWSGFAVLQSDCPVENYTYTIDAPASRPLLSIAVKDEVKGALTFSKTVKGDRIIYRWQAKNVPQLIPEPGMPPLYRCAMRVLSGTAKSWSEIASWYADLCAPRLAAVTLEMKDFVKKILKGKKSDMEKITTLFQYVSQRIRYTGITDEETAPGYEPHDVSRTFERGHGVCRDKAALLTALLKLAGFEAYPVLFMSGYPKDDDVPNIYFNHAIVGVKGKDGKDILMDPTFETTTDLLPAYLGNCSYLVATKKPTTLKRSPVIPAENNLLDIDNSAAVSGTALHGKVTMNFKGIHDQMYRATFSEWQPEEIRRYFAGALRDIIPGAELKKCTVTPANIRNMAQPLKVVLEYTAPEYLSQTELAPLALPEFSARFGTIRNLYNALKLEKRRFPLEALPRAVSENFTLKLAPGITVKSLPAKVDQSIPGVLRLNRQVAQTGSTISGKNFFAIDTAEFTPADYLKAKAALAGFETASKSLPLAGIPPAPKKKEFTQADYPGADSLVISDIRTIKFHTPNSWDDVRTIKRKIFIYGGAVQHSTVNIPYHPLMEDVTISGEFITPDGKKHILSDKEINRLDAPWAAAAKRYPAGKVLTAAFPGVEPGSTVTYTITRKVKNKPAFHLETYARSTDPTMLRRITVNNQDAGDIGAIIPIEFTEDSKDGNLSVSITDLPRLVPEASAPDPDQCVPTLKLFSIDKRQIFVKLNQALMEKVIVTPKIRELAKKLKTPEEFHKFVTKSIIEAGPALNEAPWSIFSTPEETLKSGVGNSADRAILYAALCKALNINFKFIAVSDVPETINPEFSFHNINNVERIILYLPDFKGVVVLNDSSRYAGAHRLNSLHKTVYNLTDSEFGMPMQNKYLPPFRHTMNISVVINKDSSADISVSEYYSPAAGVEFRRKMETATPEELKQFFQARCAAFAQGAVLKKFNKESAVYEFTVKDFLQNNGKYRVFELPGFNQFSSHLRLSGENRTLPWQRRTAKDIALYYRIFIPENLRVTTPGFENIYSATTSPAGGTNFLRAVHHFDEQTVRFSFNLELPFETLSPAEYHRLFKLNRMLNTPALRQVILEERKK